MRRIATAVISIGMMGWAGCGNVDQPGASALGSTDDSLNQPALWRCSAYCSTPGHGCDDLVKRKWRDCSPTAKQAAANANTWCDKVQQGSVYVSEDDGAPRDAQCVAIKHQKHPQKCQLSSGGGWGDPHMYTFDGLPYEFQPLGEFVYATDNRTYKVQMRTERYGGSLASLQTAIAVELEDGTRLAVMARQSPMFYVNGAPGVIHCRSGQQVPNGKLCTGTLELENGGWVDYDANSNNFSINFPDEVSHLEVQVLSAYNLNYVNTQFFLGPSIEATTVGALGNNNGDRTDDIMTRDGKVVQQPVSFQDMYGAYATSLRINDAESLFPYDLGKGSSTFTDTTFPASPFGVANLPTAQRNNAAAACAKSGVPVDKLDACALDVALLGDGAIKAFLNDRLF